MNLPRERVRISWPLGFLHFLTASAGVAGMAYYKFLPTPDQMVFLVELHVVVVVLAVIVTWVFAYRRYRIADDTPTSSIGSAAQGYVELVGRAHRVSTNQKEPPIPDLDCAWWSGDKYQSRSGGRKGTTWRSFSGPFLLRDETGECLVDPEGAEINVAKQMLDEGKRGYYGLYIPEGDTIHIVGEFQTGRTHPGETVHRAAVNEVLNLWKRDAKALLQRFDRDNSGEVDLAEWEAARHAAAEQVTRGRPATPRGETHWIRAPRDGRPFLVSSSDPREVLRMYRSLVPKILAAYALWLPLFWGSFAWFLR